MKTQIVLLYLTLLLLSSCQTTGPQTTISVDQFRMYATHNPAIAKFSTRARLSSLGGFGLGVGVGPSAPQKLYGMEFNEAKDKVVILDIRSTDKFAKENFGQNENVKAPVKNVPATEIIESPTESETALQNQGVSTDNILFLIGEPQSVAKKVQKALNESGYSKVLVYTGNDGKTPVLE